jgi:hypothetical protein
MSFIQPSMLHPSDRMLRQFSVLWIVFFGAFSVMQGLAGRQLMAGVFAALAVVIGPMGLVRPKFIKPIFVGWMIVAFPIGWVVSHVIMGVLFYGLFTPVSWVFKLIGRDELGLKAKKEAATYWRAKPQALNSSQYMRQF